MNSTEFTSWQECKLLARYATNNVPQQENDQIRRYYTIEYIKMIGWHSPKKIYEYAKVFFAELMTTWTMIIRKPSSSSHFWKCKAEEYVLDIVQSSLKMQACQLGILAPPVGLFMDLGTRISISNIKLLNTGYNFFLSYGKISCITRLTFACKALLGRVVLIYHYAQLFFTFTPFSRSLSQQECQKKQVGCGIYIVKTRLDISAYEIGMFSPLTSLFWFKVNDLIKVSLEFAASRMM